MCWIVAQALQYRQSKSKCFPRAKRTRKIANLFGPICADDDDDQRMWPIFTRFWRHQCNPVRSKSPEYNSIGSALDFSNLRIIFKNNSMLFTLETEFILRNTVGWWWWMMVNRQNAHLILLFGDKSMALGPVTQMIQTFFEARSKHAPNQRIHRKCTTFCFVPSTYKWMIARVLTNLLWTKQSVMSIDSCVQYTTKPIDVYVHYGMC